MNHNKPAKRSFPYVSLFGAIGFAGSVIALAVLEILHSGDASVSAHKTRLLKLMIIALLASWSTIVSLVTAWCPIILGGDRRPWLWVVPLVLGWIALVQLFDWTSLVPDGL